MNILIIGKNGQVGWELCRTLAMLGSITAIDVEEIDLASPDSIISNVRSHCPNVIVNAAAYTAVDKAESEPELAFAINGRGPGILAEEALRLDIPLVHYSTDYVYEGTKSEPVTEKETPNPRSVYGKSKLAGDVAIRESGCNHLIFRTSWVYGARGQNFMLTMLRLAREREVLKVVDDQRGAPTWSRMIAETTALALARIFSPKPSIGISEVGGIYHLTAGGQTSWYGFAEAIFRHDPHRIEQKLRETQPISTKEYPTAAQRPANSLLDNSALRERFGFALPHWEESLRLVLAE